MPFIEKAGGPFGWGGPFPPNFPPGKNSQSEDLADNKKVKSRENIFIHTRTYIIYV